MTTTEYLLTGLVIVIPLLVAGAVTLWSLEQVRYRPKRRLRPPAERRRPDSGSGSPPPSSSE